MTLDDAIKYHFDKAEELRKEEERMAKIGNEEAWGECLECAHEHEQLADWLTELKTARIRWEYIKEQNSELAIAAQMAADLAQSPIWQNISAAIAEAVNKVGAAIMEIAEILAAGNEEQEETSDGDN